MEFGEEQEEVIMTREKKRHLATETVDAQPPSKKPVEKEELELALREAEESKENPTILEGVGMVHKRLQTILSKEGVEKIQSAGSKFNPDLHDAALRVESDEAEGTIVEEIRQGYTLKGKVLRPSIVKVAENPVERESKSEKRDLEEREDNE